MDDSRAVSVSQSWRQVSKYCIEFWQQLIVPHKRFFFTHCEEGGNGAKGLPEKLQVWTNSHLHFCLEFPFLPCPDSSWQITQAGVKFESPPGSRFPRIGSEIERFFSISRFSGKIKRASQVEEKDEFYIHPICRSRKTFAFSAFGRFLFSHKIEERNTCSEENRKKGKKRRKFDFFHPSILGGIKGVWAADQTP